MRRREFIAGLAGAVALPVAARAQQAMPVIGWLCSASAAPFAHFVVAFRQGLEEAGFVEGRNVAIEYRWADGQFDRLQGFAAELVSRKVNVIFASGGPLPAQAAKAATSTIPITFLLGSDPVTAGLVASLNRPGGNVTGIYWLTTNLETKRFGLLRDLVPGAAVIGVLFNPERPENLLRLQVKEIEDAAEAVGQRILLLRARTEAEFTAAFETFARERIAAVAVAAHPDFNSRRDVLVAAALRHKLPAIFETRDYAQAGGLMSYGTKLVQMYRQAGVYTGRILKGEKPADLPVAQPTTFEFVINLKTAKTLGLTIPSGLLSAADEVIE
jgi:putative ABC transport system substrate-binding protein